MKPLAAILALILTGCASFEGNGVTLGISYEEPNTHAKIELHTAK